jgi:hypothetical protein
MAVLGRIVCDESSTFKGGALMCISNDLVKRWKQTLVETQQELDTILVHIKKAGLGIDTELLEKVITHHILRSQESSTVLCKIIDGYNLGTLNNATILTLAQWT